MSMQNLENILWVLVVLGAVYFLIRYLRSVLGNAKANKAQANQREEVRASKIQACERLLLLVQRSEFSSMILRVLTPDMQVSDLQLQLSHQLRTEWEHNAVQQLYVSDEVWSSVEEFIQAQSLQIHRKSSECSPQEGAEVLATLLLSDITLEQELAKKAKQLIKKEVKLWMES